MNPRRASLSVTYNGASATVELAPYLDGFQYKDVASGESDSCSLSVSDKDRHWIGGWFPQRGDRIKPTIQTFNWYKGGDHTDFPCGTFCVDDFSFRGGPIKMSLEAVAVPADGGFQATKRTITYESTTLQEIGQEIAARAGIALYYEAGAVTIEKVEQNDQSDAEFYRKQVERFGLAMKIFNDKIVVFSEATYEARGAKAKLTEQDMDPGWSWNTKLTGTYTGVHYQYTNSDKNKTFTVDVGGGDRILNCTESADNMTEATAIALAALNNANRGTTTMSVTVKAIPGLIATDCVEITGLGHLSGKYYIDKITHDVGNGYKMALELRLVERRFTEATSISTDVTEDSHDGEGSTSDGSETPVLAKGERYTLETSKKGYYTAAEAVAGRVSNGHPSGVVHPGTYWIFNISQGMLNLSTSQTVPGSWINPG